MNSLPDAGFGLYLHWPYCQSKCPYCDFNSHVAGQIDQKRWTAAYLAELDRLGDETSGRILQSVFFGGGTPSLMDPDLVAAILEKIRATWRMSNAAEITMEANPTSVEAGRFAAYAGAGVNRVSVGVQALDDMALRQLGRMHSVAEALKAVEIATATFPRVNFDLIYARQGQSLAAWRQELQTALGLGPSHLSLYQLTIEEGTVFYERQLRGQLRGLPDEDLGADLYLMTQDICSEAGLPAYEVSNHARPGEESRHNLTYWRGGDYIGIGPGAHGRLTVDDQRVATEGPKEPLYWLQHVEQFGLGEVPRTDLSPKEVAAEYLMMGLRLTEGLPRARIEPLLGKLIDRQALSDLVADQFLDFGEDRLVVTRSGMLVLNSVLKALLTR
ncbi:MAG: radical SAM family heme chaperone HemW [bacterium]